MKTWVVKAISLVLLISLASIGGCTGEGSTTPQETAPPPPFTVEVSFPDGAPPLGQTAELICVVEADWISIQDMSLEINLPEAFELVSGSLSWTGSVPMGDEVEVMKAVVKSVKTGNWTIERTGYLDPKKNGGVGGTGSGPAIYVSVSEDSAEWGKYPPWYEGGGFPVPVEREKAPFSGIKVDLSIPHAPVLNEAVELTCTISSDINILNTTAQIMLRRAGTPISVGDNVTTWQGDLKADEPASFSTEILFNKAGKWAIEASAWHVIDEKNSYGGMDVIYLTVGVDSGAFGWPPTGPVKVEQEGKGDVEGVESSPEEPPIEDLLSPQQCQ